MLHNICISAVPIYSGEQAVAHGPLVLDRNWVLRNRYFVILYINLYHSLGIFSRWQTDDIFLIFPRKQDLTFQANCLLRRQFAWNVKSCFLGKIRKIFQNVICWKFYPECEALNYIAILNFSKIPKLFYCLQNSGIKVKTILKIKKIWFFFFCFLQSFEIYVEFSQYINVVFIIIAFIIILVLLTLSCFLRNKMTCDMQCFLTCGI